MDPRNFWGYSPIQDASIALLGDRATRVAFKLRDPESWVGGHPIGRRAINLSAGPAAMDYMLLLIQVVRARVIRSGSFLSYWCRSRGQFFNSPGMSGYEVVKTGSGTTTRWLRNDHWHNVKSSCIVCFVYLSQRALSFLSQNGRTVQP
jgi:hypothetical protein